MRGYYFVAALACFGLAGCVESEQPPFTAEDLVFEPALLGDWESVQSGGKIKKQAHSITLGKENSYIATQVGKDAGKPAQLWLFKLGDRYFAAQLVERFSEKKELAYRVWRVVVRGGEIEFWDLDFDHLLKENPKLASVQPRAAGEIGNSLFVGPTKELRTLLASHSDDPGVWFLSFKYLRSGGLKVAEAGLLGKKQRTMDYWSQLRQILQSTVITIGRGELIGWSESSSRIEELPTEGVDAEAIAAAAYAKGLCDALNEFAENRKVPVDPLAGLIRLTAYGSLDEPLAMTAPENEKMAAKALEFAKQIEASRAKLATQHKAEFLPIK